MVERKVGQGGFGGVYQVRDTAKQERVALKTLQYLTSDSLYRFKREFRSLTDVTHRNLVQLYERENGHRARDAIRWNVGERRAERVEQPRAVGLAVRLSGFGDAHFEARDAAESLRDRSARVLGLL